MAPLITTLDIVLMTAAMLLLFLLLCMYRVLQSSSPDLVDEMLLLLLQIQPLLQHKRWETRTAAGKCIGYIAEHAKHATVAEVQAAVEASQAGGMVSPKDESGASSSEEPAEGMLSLATFDLERVLQVGTPLLASGGQVCLALFVRLDCCTFCDFGCLVGIPLMPLQSLAHTKSLQSSILR